MANTLYSCSNNSLELLYPNPKDETLLITLEEAKHHYDSFSKNLFPNARAGGVGDKSIIRQALWSQAEQHQLTNGHPVIIVPALYNNNRRLALYDDEKKILNRKNVDDLYSESKFLFYKDKNSKVQSYVITIISDEQDRKTKNFKNKGKDFSGMVLTYSMDEKSFIEGWRYQKGKALDKIGVKTNGVVNIKNARLADCFETVVESWQPIDEIEAATLGWGQQSCGAGGSCVEVKNIGGIWAKKTGTSIITICGGGSSSGVDFGSGFVGLSWSNQTGGGTGNEVFTPEMLSPSDIDILINARQAIAKNLEHVLVEMRNQNPTMTLPDFKIFGEILWDALRKSFPEFIPYASIPMDLGEAYISFMAGDYVTASINIAGVIAELVPATKGLKIAAKIVEVAPFIYDAHKAISRISSYDWATNAIIKACRDNTGSFFDTIKWVDNSIGAKIDNITGATFWNNLKNQFPDKPFSIGANPINPLEQKIDIDGNSWIKFYLESNTTGSPTIHFNLNGFNFKIRFNN